MMDETDKPDVPAPFQVVSIHPPDEDKPHFDIYKGKKVYMDIEPINMHDFQVVFFITCMHDTVMGRIDHKHILSGYLMRRRWWHNLLFIDDEALIDTAVRIGKRRWERMKTNTKQFELVREKYGLPNDRLNLDT